ncbi:hypothetical protein [Govanella unica]|uniref:Uncharacterized protein n=1 Tax=Govanella unica TaxID=2975056 RepID=A0A9X3TXN6_9PROT|nr:hypothetical protein [Govania unica]MDA5193881.1 hypothetical protein [Govania unica]
MKFESIAHWFRREVPLRVAENDANLIYLRLFVMISSNNGLLTLTALDGSEFGSGRSIGLLGFIKGKDADLFSDEPYGINLAAKRTIAEQSNASIRQIHKLTSSKPSAAFHCISIADAPNRNSSVVVFVQYQCDSPDEFIDLFPSGRTPRWMRIPAEINDISTLEYISSRYVELVAVGELTIS